MIDPIIFSIGPFSVRWYSVAYIIGIVSVWQLLKYFNKQEKLFDEKKTGDDFFMYAVFSIIIGGRLGYVFFYNFSFYFFHPLDIFKIWNGGMSFHGGLIGVGLGSYFFSKKFKINYLSFLDILCIPIPIGLFFGRIGNFINSELYGRITNSKLGIVFEDTGDLPRHPSQLYEAFLEGFCLFILLFYLAKYTKILKYKGFLTGVFLVWYGLSRFFVEFFREPDLQIGYILQCFTLGQILTLPLIIIGLVFIKKSFKNNKTPTAKKYL